MPYVHDLRCRVRGRRVSSRFYTAWQTARPVMLDVPLYRQLDGHSCSFLAALAVIRYFAPQTPVMDVLRAVAPSSTWGRGWRHLVRCLKRFGIVAEYRERLGPRTLRRLTADGKPVIVTVEPEGYAGDHWTVVRGVDLRTRRVHLTNYEEADADGSMAWAAFLADWSPRGGGWVCEQ
jgi:hypothetical protein